MTERFRVHFEHGSPMDVRAASAEEARRAGEREAADSRTVVTRVKLVREGNGTRRRPR